MAKVGEETVGALYNALTQGSKIIGTIEADSDIRIDGTVEGDLHCKGKVIIGEKGFLKGTIECLNADILGKIEGKIAVKQTLTLRQTAFVHGEVITQTLVVENNAKLNGTCSMAPESAKEVVNNKKV